MIKTYYVIFKKNKQSGEYNARFPAFPWIIVNDKSVDNLIERCEIILSRILVCIEKNNINDIEIKENKMPELKEGEIIVLIKADTKKYKKQFSLSIVRKNISIPSWLNKLAIEKNINFSKVLQDALMKECSVSELMKNSVLLEKEELESMDAMIKDGGLNGKG